MNNKITDELSNKEIWSSEYLYGVKGSYFKDMRYIDAIKEKIKLAKSVKRLIVDVLYPHSPNMSYEKITELDERVKNVTKAITYNELLLKDMEADNGN